MKTLRHSHVYLPTWLLLTLVSATVWSEENTAEVNQVITGNERRIEAVRQSNLGDVDKAAIIALLRARNADLRSGTAKPLRVSPDELSSTTTTTADASPATAPALPGRRIIVNGGAPNATVLLALEAQYRTHLRDGDYWYDPATGACGIWGGQTAGFLPPGLALAGPLPANASGGGTGVVINNRELHPLDLVQINQVLALVGSQLPAGRWAVDRNGTLSPEGGAPIVNLMQIINAAKASGAWRGGGAGGGGDNYWSSRYGAGNEDANGTGYVYIPGTGTVMYGP